MNKKILLIGIISLFILSTFSSLSVGYNVKISYIKESNTMDDSDFYFYYEYGSSKSGMNIIPLSRSKLEKKYIFPIYSNNFHNRYYAYSNFNYGYDNYSSIIQTDNVNFYGHSNESIYIVKVSNSYEVILDNLSFKIIEKTNGKKSSSGAFFTSCQIYDKNIGRGLEPLMITCIDEYDFQVKLRYLHYKLGKKINYSYENRTLKEYDNESIHSNYMEYPWGPIIPPGTWYFVFSSVIYDLDQTTVSTEWVVWMNFSGNCYGLNISTGEGGKVYGLWYAEYDANVIVSKSNMLEMVINGRAIFYIENTFFYWYSSFPIWRGFWNVNWITPDGIEKFNMIIIRGRQFYDEDEIEGCIWGMGGSGDYELITSYIDYGRTILGIGIAYYPIFVGLDLKLP